jgi:tRNA threonylcarbamoyladenosine biosynthesis protein TsaE
MTRQIRTTSAEETKAVARRLARSLFPGAVIGLAGDLGAGKTCFVKGLASGLGLDEKEITSPTFTLIAEHCRGKIPLYHVDLYRLEDVEIEELGLEEYLFGQGVSAVEWFPFLPVGVVNEYLLISLALSKGEERVLTLTARGERYEQVVQTLLGESVD